MRPPLQSVPHFGQIQPLTSRRVPEISPERQQFQELLEFSGESLDPRRSSLAMEESYGQEPLLGVNGEDIVRLYPYGISRHQLEHVIRTLTLPIFLTKELETADAILALRSHVKNHSKLRHIAKGRQIPIHMVKSNSIPQITRSLQHLLDLDDSTTAVNLELFANSGDENELEALEEARLAVEQIVIPKGQPVELLPRSARIRKMQHELAEHYRLKSLSFGDEPNRRLRIYPA